MIIVKALVMGSLVKRNLQIFVQRVLASVNTLRKTIFLFSSKENGLFNLPLIQFLTNEQLQKLSYPIHNSTITEQ